MGSTFPIVLAFRAFCHSTCVIVDHTPFSTRQALSPSPACAARTLYTHTCTRGNLRPYPSWRAVAQTHISLVLAATSKDPSRDTTHSLRRHTLTWGAGTRVSKGAWALYHPYTLVVAIASAQGTILRDATGSEHFTRSRATERSYG